MEMTSTKAELVHIRDFPESVTATIPRADFEAALGFEEPAELFLEVRGLEGDAKGESRDVSVTWSREELEQLLAETTGPAITLAFDQNELQSMLLEPEVDAHGFREKALILTGRQPQRPGAVPPSLPLTRARTTRRGCQLEGSHPRTSRCTTRQG